MSKDTQPLSSNAPDTPSTDTPLTEEQTSSVESPFVEPASPKVIKKGGAVAWLSLILSLFLVCTILWMGWQFYLFKAEHAKAQTGLKQALSNQQHTHSKQLTNTLAMAASKQSTIAAEHDKILSDLVNEVRTRNVDVNAETARVDARHLIGIAHRKITLESDRNAALSILASAQKRLADLKDPQWLKIKKAIAIDIGTVKSLPEHDHEATYLQLLTIEKQLMNLPVNEVQIPTSTEEEEDLTLSQSTDDWQRNVYKTWRKLTKDFITVRRRKGEVQPLMTPEQESNLRQNTVAKVVQAQTALLNKKPKIYEQALLSSLDWVNRYYAVEQVEVQALIKQLTALAHYELAANYPEIIFDSLVLLKNDNISKKEKTEQLENAIEEEVEAQVEAVLKENAQHNHVEQSSASEAKPQPAVNKPVKNTPEQLPMKIVKPQGEQL